MPYNAPNALTDCLYTTVRNISATARYFGFLGMRGKRLDPDEECTVWGSLQSWLLRHTPDVRARRSLEEAIAGDVPTMVIVKTPAVHLWDTVLYVTKIIALQNSVLLDVDPCWGTYSSSV